MKQYLYKIVCKNPSIKEWYIGRTNDIRKRTFSHKNACKNKDIYLYRYIRENGGWCNFDMVIMEEFDDISKEEISIKEIKAIYKYKPGLNSQHGVGYNVY